MAINVCVQQLERLAEGTGGRRGQQKWPQENGCGGKKKWGVNSWMDSKLDDGKASREDWLTFTWGRTFIWAPNAPAPVGALSKHGCHLLTGGRISKPSKTHSGLHTLHMIYYSGCLVCHPAAILACKQETFIVKLQILIIIMIYNICLQKNRMKKPL